MTQKVHIGRKIREAVKRKGIPVAQFAVRIGYSRRSAYAIFEKESISTELLEKISEVLGEDLFVNYYGNHGRNRMVAQEPSEEKEYRERNIRDLVDEAEYNLSVNRQLKEQLKKARKKN